MALIKGIGVNVDTRRVNGSMKKLWEELKFFQSVGFDYVEIPPAGLDVIVRGRILEKRLQRFKDILSDFDFRYTIHAPDVINLRHRTNPLHYKVMEATVRLAGMINAEVVVYHCGTVEHSLDLREKTQKDAEVKALKRLAKLAAENNTVIGVENVGHSADEVLEVIKRVNHPNVRMVLDLGHLYIVSTYRGLDFYRQVSRALEYTVELHVSDNFAESPQTYQDVPNIESFQFVYGIGDLHLPLGEGEMPYTKLLKMIRESSFNGIVTLEINSMDRFKDDYADSLNLLRRRLIGRNGGLK